MNKEKQQRKDKTWPNRTRKTRRISVASESSLKCTKKKPDNSRHTTVPTETKQGVRTLMTKSLVWKCGGKQKVHWGNTNVFLKNFMLFVPCIVIQLCNTNQQMHTLQINILIQFLVYSTCFEHHLFIIRKTICTCSFVWYVFHTLYVSSLAGGRTCSISSTSFHLLDCLHKMYEKHTIQNCMYKWSSWW